MSRQKLKRFAENKLRDNVIEPGKEIFETIRGNWNQAYFGNNHPNVLEVACGRGEYTIGLARKFPHRNFIGLDLKGDRIWKGAGIAIEEGMSNVAFLRVHAHNLTDHFAHGEVSEVWVMFPDPRPKNSDEKRRLTHPRFIDVYKSILEPDGYVRLKTDDTDLFEYTLETLQERSDLKDLQYTFDVYASEYRDECHDIKTRYEKKFAAKGRKIKYLRFQFETDNA